MREYRFTGLNVAGQPVQGTVYAPSRKKAEKRVSDLAAKHDFSPEQTVERVAFLYKARHPSGEIVKGEQWAYAVEEVERALTRVGLEPIRVEKKLLSFQPRPSSTDLVLFVRLAANMLRRNLPFDEVLTLLQEDTTSSSLKQAIRDLNSDLKAGMDARHAFMKHQHTLGKFTAFMLGLAATSGNMADMFEATATYLERKDKFKKSVRSAMITPSITFLAALVAFVWYVWSIVPSYARLFQQYGLVEIPFFTASSLAFADWMDIHWWWVSVLFFGSIIGFVVWARTPKGKFQVHKNMYRIPALGTLLQKMNLEVFSRVFSVLYSGSGESEEVMKVSAEATDNVYLEHQVKTITVPMMMAAGSDLIIAMERAGVFTPMFIARYRSGAETGSVREAADEMADFYQREVDLKFEALVETIKTSVAIVISMLVLLLTIISAESALMTPSGSDFIYGAPGQEQTAP